MSDKTTRELIVESADRLFYQRGFDLTSFADIAGAVKISRGNFYYHFKTKDEILDAVIEFRLVKTRTMLEGWEQAGTTPKERLYSFARMLIANKDPIMQYGCPVGTLCAELAKLQHASRPEAHKLFALFHDWLRQQFVQLGCIADASSLAMHLLARSQGIATLANAFQDESFVQQEVDDINAWIDFCEKKGISSRKQTRSRKK
jgi:AcrR family transcriptional regulator